MIRSSVAQVIYSRLCRSCICGGRMGQITGKAPVKPCALFCCVGGITLHGWHKTHCKRLRVAVLQQGKIKALHPPADARQKKSPATWAGWIVARELNFVLVKKCFHFVIVVFCQLVIPLIIRYMISSCREVFFLVACKIKILIAF